MQGVTEPSAKGDHQAGFNACAQLLGEDIAQLASQMLGNDELEEIVRVGEESALIQAQLSPYYQAVQGNVFLTSSQSE